MEQNKQNEKKDATTATGTTGVESHASTKNDFSSGSKSAETSTGTTKNTTAAQDTQSTASAAADKVASTVGSVLRGDTGAATGAAKGIISQVKESGGKVAGEAFTQVKEKAASKIDEQKATLAQGLGGVAQTIRQVGETLKDADEPSGVASKTAEYGDTLARQVEQFSTYLEKNNVSELLREVERFARRNPAYFIGGAFVLGLLGARFLKSSSPNQALTTRQSSDKSGKTDGKEIFHHHTGNEAIDKGKPVSGSGEGVRPV
jgi:hypothetical protein